MSAANPPEKVTILFKAAGGAPVLKQPKVKISSSEKFQRIVKFLQESLKQEHVFVYLKEAFSPSLDEQIAVLLKAYGNEGQLIVSYSVMPAWG